MRILHISTRLILGGSQENTVLSCEGQANLGHDVHLAFGPIHGPEGSLLDRVESFRTNTGDRITTHVVPDLVRELSVKHDIRAYRQLKTLIADLKPDIVHTHSSKAGILGRAAAWKAGGRTGRLGVVHTIHGLPFHPYQSKRLNALYIASERFAARRCHTIVTVCDAMMIQALLAGVGVREQFRTVYSGMETEAFVNCDADPIAVRHRLGIAPDDFIIGTVARLAELKGHDDLLDALGPMMQSNKQLKLLWVGDGYWAPRLLDRVRDMGLQASIITTGLVDPGRVPELMRAMDVLVHPSYREGLPRTVPQALLSGIPVIAYNLDGAPEVCRPRETGLLVEPGNHDQLSDAVQWMIEHPDERLEMADRGQQECATRFSVERMVTDLQEVYRSVAPRD